ncbi:hypothetical protein BJ085DRAFT_30280 [Dimargaris cristalligena]|uniref:RING finger protein 37 N-terminal domain-containing protein n=1 Tax=Dimargaris cristalligena TaxID=215637 RepID=A0A4P9ZXX3_9FUNG|nr:hypothetical protein BJ085DRAFT_30280 [Dimargaris cristalligena]|eukprot:RKP37600.1 hypothetical protein BJ085DRAFT_30280 [Dimargaris cristalligena]
MHVVNLVQPNYLQAISCEPTPTRDGHEVENLLSPVPNSNHSDPLGYSNVMSKPVSFMAESFVKPPVKISLEFRAPIYLWGHRHHHHPYATKFGSQSLGPLHQPRPPVPMSLGTFNVPAPTNTNKQRILGLCSSKPIPDFDVRQQIAEIYPRGDQIQWYHFQREPRNLNRIARLDLYITSVHGPSLVALQSLQVWGLIDQPMTTTANSSPTGAGEEYVKSGESQSPSSSPTEPICNSHHDSPTPHHLINERTANPVEEVVPADFLDALTYEVVKNPQRLPSGNMCDYSTNILSAILSTRVS